MALKNNIVLRKMSMIFWNNLGNRNQRMKIYYGSAYMKTVKMLAMQNNTARS